MSKRRRKPSKQLQELLADRLPGSRQITKTQAIRHLLHASIRMHLAQEDPFATHLVTHSCDRLITELVKAKQLTIGIDFMENVYDEYKEAFLYLYREVYNYLKHADDDAEALLEVRNIYETNELTIFLNCGRYLSLPDSHPSAHAQQYLAFVAVRSPHLISIDAMKSMALTIRQSTQGIKYQTYVEAFRDSFLANEEVRKEIKDDLVDVHATHTGPWWRD